ncbi:MULTISPECIES: hypothetical protein [Lysinibacillus]|uniref:Uncharacterized protein n=1 Tax=Lysinibacillus antri TaxID=2498145 RepID=A0A432L8K1_9BACI|nr:MULTISPECIES: hypothetical protein [Lysinibacillus]RUL48700.1 hypothetical protein EK386_16590 [Lysinibacillus antri]TSI08680.1 hypothetical protein FJQ64_06955 [Lysinibacillus sp. BW-2-10]
MKRIFAIGIIFVIVVYLIFFGDFSQFNQEQQEFKAFIEDLDDTFFQLSEDSFHHFNEVVDALDNQTFTQWYFSEGGREENITLQGKIEDAQEDLLLEELHYEPALLLKDNIIEQLILFDDTFNLLYNSPSNKEDTDFSQLKLNFTKKVDELTILGEKMEEIIEQYGEK